MSPASSYGLYLTVSCVADWGDQVEVDERKGHTVMPLIVATGERCDVMHEAIRNRNGGPCEA